MRYKSPEGLNSQLSSAEQTLGSEFFPNDEKRAEVLDMDLEGIKNKYPYRYEQYAKILKEAKGNGTSEQELISIRKYIALISNLESYIASYEKDQPEGFLREHQQDVFHKIAEFLNKGHKAGYLDLPTGFGKTVLFVELVKALSKGDKQNKKPLKTLVLVPTQDLVTQTIGRAVKKENLKGFAKFAPDINVTAYYQNEKDLTGDVVVSTYQSFITLQKTNPKFTEQFDLVIFDEAHKALGEVTKEQIKAIAPHSLRIGCTATSEYNSGRSVEDVLPELIHEIQPKEAIELGILANPRGFLYRTGIKIEGDSNDLADYSADVLKELNSAARNKITVDFVKTFVSKGIRGLVPCFPGDKGQHSVDMADLIANEKIIDVKTKKERNIITRSITQDTGKGVREKIYEAFQNGEIDCITYIDILTTGVDLPNAKFLVRCRPRKSKIQSVQEIGRLLRPYEGEDPYIVEIEDDFPLGEKPYTIFDMFEVTSITQGQKLVSTEVLFPEQKTGLSTGPLNIEEGQEAQLGDNKDFTVGLDTEKAFVEDISEPKVKGVLPEKNFITADYDTTSEREKMEEEDRKRELIRELLGKMSVEPILIRELKINEGNKGEHAPEGWLTNFALTKLLISDDKTIKKIAEEYRKNSEYFGNYPDSNNQLREHYSPELVLIITNTLLLNREKAKYNFDTPEGARVVLESDPKIEDLLNCDLLVFLKTRFGKNKVLGQTILRHFGNRKENTANLFNLFKLAGLEVGKEQRLVDYTNAKELRLLLSASRFSLKQLTNIEYNEFKRTKFGGGDSGFVEVSGGTILRRFGNGKENSENLNELFKFIETKEAKSKSKVDGKEIDYTKSDDLKKVLNNASPPLDFLSCRYQDFRNTKFGGGDSGFKALGGQVLLRNFSGKENYQGLEELLKFAGIEVVKVIDYNNPKQLREILLSNPRIDLMTINLKAFINSKFGGIGTKFLEVNGRTVLIHFGDGKVTLENYNALRKFVGIQ